MAGPNRAIKSVAYDLLAMIIGAGAGIPPEMIRTIESQITPEILARLLPEGLTFDAYYWYALGMWDAAAVAHDGTFIYLARIAAERALKCDGIRAEIEVTRVKMQPEPTTEEVVEIHNPWVPEEN